MGILKIRMTNADAKSRPILFSLNNNPGPCEPPKDEYAMARTPAAVAGLTKEDSDPVPRFLPLLLLLSVLLWSYTTTGGRQVFVKKVLGGAYDSQAEHFLRGNVDVDVEAIGHEAIIVNDHVRMYFGPFPAFLRILLNFVYPAGHGKWSRISGFCAGVIALFAFAGLMRTTLHPSSLSSRSRNWVGNACIVGFALGSPLLLLLGNLSIYDEAIIWGLAWSLAALYFALRSRQTEAGALTRSLLGFSLCAAGALLSRATFGMPFILIAPLLALRVGREKRMTYLISLFLPLCAALAFYVWLSYARFGSFAGVNYNYYINPVHSEFAHKYGPLSPRRIPYGFADYFERGVAVAFLAQFFCVLSYFTLAQRYATDLYPFLIFCFVVFLSSSRAASLRSRYILIGLVALSVVINSLTTVSWLVDADLNVPAKTRAAWEQVLGRRSYEKWK